jgi:hypothetical protein
MRRVVALVMASVLLATPAFAQTAPSARSGLSSLMRLADAQTRSISPENLTGEKGRGGMATLADGTAALEARELGQGWKVQPYVNVAPGETFALGEIEGPGIIQHIWMTVTGDWRNAILRMYWDGEDHPSVESPVGDFFAQGWGEYAHINALTINVNPGSGFNSFWPKPFRERGRLTMTNIADHPIRVYYQINYALTPVGAEVPYFHAQFRRTNPLPYKDVHTIVDGIRGKGHYVGTYLAHGANSPGWWGEGEIKFYMDGDTDFATIVGTGEEDYFLGSYFYATQQADGSYADTEFTTPYAGFHTISRRGSNVDQRRFGQYRVHITDPIRFDEDLRVTVQALGWKTQNRYLPLQDDMASVAFWYQLEPHNPFPALPSREELAIVWAAPLNHLGRISTVRLQNRPHARFNRDSRALVDGQLGSVDASDGRWMGFEGDFVATFDLGSIRAVQEITIGFLQDQPRRSFYPAALEFLGSTDGRTFESLHRIGNEPVRNPDAEVRRYGRQLPHRELRYVRVVARNVGRAPSWHEEAGRPAWLFIDEVVIR